LLHRGDEVNVFSTNLEVNEMFSVALLRSHLQLGISFLNYHLLRRREDPMSLIEELGQDVRSAIRSLLRSPGFAAVVILTLTLGIGANTAIFSIVNGVILRPLGYPKPDQLMFLTTQFPTLGFLQFWVSAPEYLEFRQINRSFSDVGAYTLGEVNLTAGDRPLRVRSAQVDEHLLNALGVQPVQGRLFAKGETDITGPPPAPGGPPTLPPAVAILSHELWQSAFARQPMIGQKVEVNGVPREVIGIMPPRADLMENRTQIWLPLGLNPGNPGNRGGHFLYLIGRLKEGVTAQAAERELNQLIQNWSELAGGVKGHLFTPLDSNEGGHILQMKPLRDEMLGSISRSIWVMQAAVAFVLLIACSNLANLLLARAEARYREFAVRRALGASRIRLVRYSMTEGLLLSIVGGALGLVLARLGLMALIRAYPNTLPRSGEIIVDPFVLLFTLGISILTGLLFGLTPLMHTRFKSLSLALKEGGAKGATGSARHHVRHGLVVAEVALSVVLVIGAGLLLRTVYNLMNVDAGFSRARLVTFSMTLPGVNYLPSTRVPKFQRLLESIRAVPGVQSATAMTGLPPNRQLNANDTDIDGYRATSEGPPENVDYYQNVMSNYFETMGIPIERGRSFQSTDAGASGMVAVVNQTLANTFWKDRDPVGQRLRPCCSDQIPWFTIVGVAKDVKQGGVDKKTGTELYFLLDQTGTRQPPFNAPVTMNIVLRTTLPPASLSPVIERVVHEADASIPVVRFRDMESVFDEAIERPRLLAQLLGIFAGLALVLAAIGIYGVLSYLVAEQRREIGIRLALGADRGNVIAQVMKRGLLLTMIGGIIGLAGVFGVNRLIASLLFGVQPTDAVTLTAVVATITLVAAIACWLPAWRASRLNPNIVLRED
jgi:predicted permease